MTLTQCFKRLFFLCCCACLCAFAPHLFAAEQNQVQHSTTELHSVNQKIKQLSQLLSRNKHQRSHLEKELQGIEEHIGTIISELQKTTHQLKQQQAQLKKLQQQQQAYKSKLQNQRAMLAEQAKAAYIMGRQEYLKMLLNQQNPAMVGRTMTYFKYFNHSRIGLINNLTTTIAELNANQKAIEKEAKKLAATRKHQQQEKTILLQQQHNRQTILAKLTSKIRTRSQQLASLRQDKQRLQTLIKQLQLQNPVTGNHPPLPFAKLKGKLPWPTKGVISHHFGETIKNSELKWNGTLLTAPEGRNIYAIYPGKVIFSGWLKGFGLLLIIDHGDGYMSLYSRNQSLYQKVGQHVSAGDLIAKVGQSGGYTQSGLYFEIRYNGNPVNPEKWCHKGRTKRRA